MECKVRGFTLNYETLQTLNYYTTRDNILKELDHPMQQRQEMAITIPDFFARDETTKKIKLTERVKKYGLVFDTIRIQLVRRRRRTVAFIVNSFF